MMTSTSTTMTRIPMIVPMSPRFMTGVLSSGTQVDCRHGGVEEVVWILRGGNGATGRA